MGVTIQDIAARAGVSRGTVDRALNNRGRINPDVAKRIQDIAAEMGYQTNRAARALSIAKQKKKIGVLIQASDTPFMKDVLEGITDAEKEAAQFGISIVLKSLKSQDADEAVRLLEELIDDGCHALALTPIQDDRLVERVNTCVQNGIPVITFNSDLSNSKRICFIGQDPIQSGRVAAGLMAESLPAQSAVAVISGFAHNNAHQHREQGFLQELKKIRPDLRCGDIYYANDKDSIAGRIAKQILPNMIDREDPESFCGIYLAAAGLSGVCQAIDEADMSGRVKLISNDLTEKNKYLMRSGKVHFLIGQDAYNQGYEPVMLLFNWLVEGRAIEPGMHYTDIQIRTKYNIG